MIYYLPIKEITESFQPQLSMAIQSVVEKGWFLLGDETTAFQREYASYIGTRNCVACANGYDALSLILQAYLIQGLLHKGDEVLVPANTFIASVLAITRNELVPVFVEPDGETFVVTEHELRKSITKRTRALMLVHLYGMCAYNREIETLCREYNLIVIEDNAQAHGAVFEDKRTGSLGHASAHSFYPGKNLAALGDGGAVTTDDNGLATLIASIANYGSTEKYVSPYPGVNSRLDEIQAAVLRLKLKRLNADNQKRRQIARHYLDNIRNSLVELPQIGNIENHVFHIFALRTKYRDALRNYLANCGIQTLIHYPIPPHKQQCYSEYNRLSLPITEALSLNVLSIPLHPMLLVEDMNIIVESINRFKI